MTRNVDRTFLKNAKINRNDEFYTQLIDIENELIHYKHHFKDKIVLCNCDDIRFSNFFRYFSLNFKKLGIKKLICSSYKKEYIGNNEQGFWYEYTGNEGSEIKTDDIMFFKGDGDFRNIENIELLKKADIVVTNPPFSLFREYIDQIIKYEKKFLVIGNINCITYKEIFKLIQNNQAWLGINLGRGISGFIVPKHYELYGTETKINENGERIISPNNCLWLTNLDNSKRHENIPLTKKYYGNEGNYPRYDNYDAINVNKTKDIPIDYNGIMGVPITFLHKFNPEQFEIIQFRKGSDGKDLSINGKNPYFRILIKKKF
ncbi:MULTISPECIES: adenine-specific methyltransferase EcoRI family protein [Neisseria]|jgi:modification methylase ecoRI|uniref:adenine-specific methyltransferase EcoRI family protein n=1 Tax=Neisseria TaxID=482 RepID=UPI000D2F6B28|nr:MULTISPECIES: adenine-specific methyltransferase EcoRI family protein [Neisseria]